MLHFRSIHYLRGLAAIMVVVLHVFTGTGFMVDAVGPFLWLMGGVDIFFVISGFVMVQSTADRRVSPAHFLRQRAVRIVPLYWVATLIVMTTVDGQWALKLASLTFVPMMNPAVGMMQPVLEPGWTINYEMFFYALFAATLMLAERWRLMVMAGALGGLVMVTLVLGGDDLLGFYGRPIVLEFVLGMAIARYRVRLPVIAVPLGLAAMIAGELAGIDRLFAFGLPAALLVAGALRAEERLPHVGWAQLLGSASYAIYLFHLSALSFFLKLWPDPALPKALFVIAAAVFMIAVGCLLHFALERPIAAWMAQRKASRTGPALVSAP